MLMMRRTVAVAVRICTGLAEPSSMGPMVMPSPAAVLSRLKAMLAASRVGKISRLASVLHLGVGEDLLADVRIQRRVAVHLAFHFQILVLRVEHHQRLAHLLGGRRVVGAEAGVRQHAMRGTMPKRRTSRQPDGSSRPPARGSGRSSHRCRTGTRCGPAGTACSWCRSCAPPSAGPSTVSMNLRCRPCMP
jgi:hypothetical protein